ncbi:lipopolysaccharide biosynthesis protein [Streptomyces sp. NPDC048717]|uniref:lipopolysaccharide biosynthesis protein n=1 Tax=Streptomyces sp. NPDC048717 TaxID=3154928 RepID=UPI00342AA149
MTSTASTASTASNPGTTARPRLLPLARWTVLPAAVLAGAAAGAGYGVVKTPQYAATSYVLVVPDQKADPAAALGFAQAYGRVATDLAVTGGAQGWAGVPVATLRSSVRAETSPDAPMVSITARSPKPAKAVAMADSVARALVLDSTRIAANTGVRVVEFARATKPTTPVSPSPRLAALVGACAGGLLGGLGLLVRPKRAAVRGAAGDGRRLGAALDAPSARTSDPVAVPAPAAAAQQPEPETV